MSIPLITIVAQFALAVFLPIVVALFQLYALLRLKFCIPPNVSLNAGELASINLALRDADSVDADPAAHAAVRLALGSSLGSDAAADAALGEYTESAFADTIRAIAKPTPAARAVTAEIAPRTFETEIAPS
jgi:hypothetical protein